MESALDQIRDLYAKADALERHKIQDQIRSLQDELYTDWEVLFGQATGVSTVFPNLLSNQFTQYSYFVGPLCKSALISRSSPHLYRLPAP
jgi:hypothetical protein